MTEGALLSGANSRPSLYNQKPNPWMLAEFWQQDAKVAQQDSEDEEKQEQGWMAGQVGLHVRLGVGCNSSSTHKSRLGCFLLGR